MAKVLLSKRAAADIELMIRTHSLPGDAKARLGRTLSPLGNFPRIGPELTGQWSGLRFVLGPWPWMIVVYKYFEASGTVVILTVQDARSSLAATGEKRR